MRVPAPTIDPPRPPRKPAGLPVDEDVAERWGQLAASAMARGAGLSVIDGLIAATALTHGLTVVTRNTADIAAASAPVLNPWSGA
jgi:predicted nucleic acid-binding protein